MKIGASLSGLSFLLPIGLLVTVCLTRAIAISFGKARNSLQTWFTAYAAGYVVYLVVCLAATETLSAFRGFNREGLICWWVLYIAAAAIVTARLNVPLRMLYRQDRPRYTSVVPALMVFGAVACFLLWLGATSASNSPDAMNYHLTRAATWASNGSVNNYPTYSLRQLYYGRLDEYLLTQGLLLDGTDRFVFLPQWIAYVSSVVMVAGLARLLSGRRSAALWGFLLAATLPLGILQATTALNDLFVGTIMLSASYLAVVLWRLRRPDAILLILVGAAGGLAVVTKVDAILGLVPLGAAVIVMAWRDHWPVRTTLRWGTIALVVALALTLPMTLRNLETFHNIVGQTTSEDRVVSTANPVLLGKNALRNLLNNVDILQAGVNSHVTHFEATVGGWLHLDHPSPSTTVPFLAGGNVGGSTWPYQGLLTPTDDGSGSLVGIVGLLVSAIALLWARVRMRTAAHELVPLFLSSVVTLGLALLLVRWGPWGARFQLIALLPVLACIASTLSALTGRVLQVVGTLVIAGSVILVPFALFQNASKPLVGGSGDLTSYRAQSHDSQYFRWCPSALKVYDSAIAEVHHDHQHEIGYVSDWFGGFLYPLWALLSERSHGALVQVVPVAIDNRSGRDTRSAGSEPRVTLVLSQTASLESSNAQRLLRLGYREQSVTRTECEFVGLYVGK